MFTKQTINFFGIGRIHSYRHRCSACNKTFDTLDENVNHIWSAHSPIKECPKCQTILQYREFSFVHSKQHMMIYECDDCGYLGESWKVLPDPYN
jgi:predicted RNA-binding Zn-ribbon protein involved in translation (DUF1610 family)